MNTRSKRLFSLGLLMCIIFVSGCSMMLDMAVTGAGSTAQIEPINFFKSTADLTSEKNSGEDFSDYYYISNNANWTKYKRVIINDFTSITPDMRKISGLQIPEFKNLRKDIPDNISNAFDGSIFSQCSRSSGRIDHNDMGSIRKARADAIIFGNISEMKSMGRGKGGGIGLTSTQVEIKIVDTKSGKEILKMVNRSTTDGDKVSMPINRRLANLINKAKNAR